MKSFVAENRETLGTTSDKLASVSHSARRQPRRHQADRCTSPRTRSRTSSTSTSPPRARSPVRWRSTTSPTRSNSSAGRSRPPRGWAPSSRRSCACNTWRRSSRTASTTSRRWARTCSSARRRGPTRSPTARTGCARTTFRPATPHRRPDTPRRRAAAARGAAGLADAPAAIADRSGRRACRGMMVPPGARIMIERLAPAIAAAPWCCCLTAVVALSGCGWRGLNSLAAAGHPGRRPRLLHDPGAAARRRQH